MDAQSGQNGGQAHVDIETYSETDLLQAGAYRYAECPSTEVLSLAFAVGDDPVELWIPRIPVENSDDPQCDDWFENFRHQVESGLTPTVIHWGPIPEKLARCTGFRAHNAEFERVVLSGHAGKTIGFPHTQPENWVCTAAKAAAHGMPRALKKVCEALETPHQKDDSGSRVMKQLSKPRRPTKNNAAERWWPADVPDRYVALYAYNVDDVLAERDVDHAVPDLPPLEQRIYWLDQRINDRGVRVDVESTEKAWALVQETRSRLDEQCRRLTGYDPDEKGVSATGATVSQTEKLTRWIRAQGYPISDLQKDTVADALADAECPAAVGKVLRLRKSHAMKAPDKYAAILRSHCADGRVRGMFLYYGGGTGRWSSRIVQLQNLFARGGIEDPETAIEAYADGDLDWIRRLYDCDPMLVFASTIRGMLVASEGCDLLWMDYSSIEARITAWFAGQEDVLEVFRTHGLIYEHTAAKMGNLDHTDVEHVLRPMKKKHSMLRFAGKTGTLAFGFQGGAKAYMKGAAQGGMVVEEAEAEQRKREWREANRKIVSFWYDIEDAARAAVQQPGRVFSAGGRYAKVHFSIRGRWLYMKLPSGRKLAYYKPGISATGEIRYTGVDTATRAWTRTSTYGGRLTENAVQATAADLLRLGMTNLESGGYPIVGTVHDEVISEMLEGQGDLEEMSALMCRLPAWAEGLPVKAAGTRAKRYRKDD